MRKTVKVIVSFALVLALGSCSMIHTLLGTSSTSTSSSTTVSTPTISPSGGTFSAAQTVTMYSSTYGASIYYTIDGSTPTISSTYYSGSFYLSTSATIRAIAVLNGVQSQIASAYFTITAASDDSYEDNDTIFTAKTLSSTGSYSLIANDDDWFKVFLPSGYTGLSLSLSYQSSQGDIDLELYDSTEYLLDSSYDTTGYESINCPGLTGGTYYYISAYIYGSNNLNQPYTLSWTYY